MAYVSVVGVLGTGVIAHSLWEVSRAPFDVQWLWLVGLTVASSAAVLQLATSRVAFSVAEIFTFTAVLLFGPSIGTLTVAIDCAVVSARLAVRGRPLRRTILTVTAPTLAMWIAAHLLFRIADVDRSVREPGASAAVWLSLAASAVVYYLLNTGMIAVAVAWDEHRPVWHVWRDHFAPLWVSFLVGAHAAWLIMFAVGGHWLYSLAFVAPIPLLLYYAMRTWVAGVNKQVVHLQQMHEQSQVLHEQQALRLQTEVALRERDREFQAVFDAALDALFLVDDDRRVVRANSAACALLGVSPNQLPSPPLDSFLTMSSADALRATWLRMLATGQHQGELVTAVGGRERHVEFSLKAEAVPHRHLFVWRDVSERKALEAQLQQSQKLEAVGRLAGGVAHDFNNLLTVILGHAALLLEDAREEESLHQIVQAAERAATLTKQLLAFSRKQRLEMNVVNLNRVVSGMETTFSRLLDQSIEVTTVLDPALGAARVDVAQLEQVLVNLVANARDAMPDGGRLTVATANVTVTEKITDCSGVAVSPGRYVVLSATDTGRGMDPATVAQIFEPFFTTKSSELRSGLGLSTVYGIVRQSDGHLLVESSPGAGSTFSVYLPRLEQPPSEVISTANPEVLITRPHTELLVGDAEARSGPLAGSETVLLVEDEEALRQLGRRTLERHGYTVLPAAGAEEAFLLAARSATPIDLLVTDVLMPRINGKDLAIRLRNAQVHLKVLFVSGYTGEMGHLEAAVEGAAFLQKPFTPAALARAVRQLLDRPGASGMH